MEPGSPVWQADSLPAELSGKPKNTGVGNLSLLQGIFLTQELNQVDSLQADSLTAEPARKPKNTGVGSLSLLQEIYLTQDWTGVSCMAGVSFTCWATRFSLVTYFIHGCVYMLIPISQFMPPLFFPLGVHTFVLCLCVSCLCFANRLICYHWILHMIKPEARLRQAASTRSLS